jgi:hypothetical protein
MSILQIDQAMTDKMVDNAIAYCTENNFSGNTQKTLQALRQGRCDICGYVCESLGRQIGEYLGMMDKTVKAVYKYNPEYAAMRQRSSDKAINHGNGGVNLIAWVDRKSAALDALGSTLESVISTSRRKIGCEKATPACYTLDVQIVNNDDVTTRRGYGVIVNSMYVHSTQVWAREEAKLWEEIKHVRMRARGQDLMAIFDPELAPESRILEQALAIDRLPSHERAPLMHQLQEAKVVLIRRMISDQLTYINIAKDWFTIADLAEIQKRKIGYGKIGGKAAGMMLAARILNEVADEDVQSCIRIPESYFLGSDLIYLFMAMNGLMHRNDQKYKPEDRIRSEYPQIQEEFQAGEFPPEVLIELQAILEKVRPKPVIVRSSSQLEDNFGTSFAGKYDSFFCPNQGSPEENLRALTRAISCTYASTLKPEALLYRRSKGLQDYDERMAVLIQVVEGDQFGDFYLPQVSGVAFSRNIFRWSPQIKPEAGFARLVWGLGTRAVQRLGDDYPRLVALSHPTLQPDDSTEAIRHYSQRKVDLIDLEANTLKTLPIHQVLNPSYAPLNLIAQVERDGFFSTPRMRLQANEIPNLTINFHEFLHRTDFASLLIRILRTLEKNYHSTLDLEFTVHLPEPRASQPTVQITLLQCRPQSYLEDMLPPPIPKELPEEDILFSTDFMVPRGYLSDIRYILYIHPEAYFGLPSQVVRNQVSQTVAKLNSTLEEKSFICIGPGRWGSTNLDLGVYVSYTDIHNAAALIELSGREIGTGPEPSLGTHFFQDLMEAHIYPLAIPLDDDGSIFNHDFFEQAPNAIESYLELDQILVNCLQLVDISTYSPGCHLEVIMDDEASLATAFLVCEDE